MSILSLLTIRTREPRPAAPKRRHLLTEMRDGLAWILKTPILRWLALIGFCCNFSMITVWTMFLFYGANDLHLALATLAAVVTAVAWRLLGRPRQGLDLALRGKV
ncbi:hypothetical protein [Solihabitans fulvus]|uniref:hypothetical protein n=1 Tax=Solihabitans fulvus TaxID=1892852 RepID=UPI001661BF70|nr:hypothetical protein [Solihabitans fulvus]